MATVLDPVNSIETGTITDGYLIGLSGRYL